jgi:hypothetical protein
MGRLPGIKPKGVGTRRNNTYRGKFRAPLPPSHIPRLVLTNDGCSKKMSIVAIPITLFPTKSTGYMKQRLAVNPQNILKFKLQFLTR